MNNTKCCYTRRQIDLMNKMRMLWEQHIQWTRAFIISTAANLGDLEAVTKRLLENPADFAETLKPFYGCKISDEFKKLFTQHLLIAADLVNALKANNKGKADAARKKWYANADDISVFLSKINPNWNKAKWRTLLGSHLQMTEKEAILRLRGNYAEDIKIYDDIEQEALKMADYMSTGIIRQFSVK